MAQGMRITFQEELEQVEAALQEEADYVLRALRAALNAVERILDLGGDESTREWGLRMLIVSRCLERIGDHAVDIGEQTSYLVTAQFREFTDASHPEEAG